VTVAALAAALALLPVAAAAGGGAFRLSPHGRSDTGVLRLPNLPRGDCGQCHGGPRGATGRTSGQGRGHARLFAPNDDSLCAGCHERPAGTWLGERSYRTSAHGGSPSALWPGPEPRARRADDAGKCVNCHDPHGVKDAAGLVPGLLHLRDGALCLGCHAGDPATDVATSFARVYGHPLLADNLPGSARAAGGPLAAPQPAAVRAGGPGPCSACHNAHEAGQQGIGGQLAGESAALAGASRVRVANRQRGSAPILTPVAAGNPGPVREYEVCFKCHASPGDRDRARIDVSVPLNPANASYHPVEAPGRNLEIDRRAFAPGWGPERLVTCSDCHGSDDEVARGPHGSAVPHILSRRYAATSSEPGATETDLCFSCHAFRTYADPGAGAERRFSRFDGHGSHVAGHGLSCWACHTAHGSPTLAALLVLRSPGLMSYGRQLGGGTCTTASCHVTTPATVCYGSTCPR
jgi:predicted CXXCH cytochrome family protein